MNHFWQGFEKQSMWGGLRRMGGSMGRIASRGPGYIQKLKNVYGHQWKRFLGE